MACARNPHASAGNVVPQMSDAAQPVKSNRRAGSYGCKPNLPFLLYPVFAGQHLPPTTTPTADADVSKVCRSLDNYSILSPSCAPDVRMWRAPFPSIELRIAPHVCIRNLHACHASPSSIFRALVNAADESYFVALSDGYSTTRKFVLRPLVIFRYANVNKFAHRHIQIKTRICNRPGQIIRFKRKPRSGAISV
jgi:hypothetical protein